jgi:hypothetical protein
MNGQAEAAVAKLSAPMTATAIVSAFMMSFLFKGQQSQANSNSAVAEAEKFTSP